MQWDKTISKVILRREDDQLLNLTKKWRWPICYHSKNTNSSWVKINKKSLTIAFIIKCVKLWMVACARLYFDRGMQCQLLLSKLKVRPIAQQVMTKSLAYWGKPEQTVVFCTCLMCICHIARNFWGRKPSRISQFYGYLQKLGAWYSLAWHKQAICESFLYENHFFKTNSWEFSPSKVSHYMVCMCTICHGVQLTMGVLFEGCMLNSCNGFSFNFWTDYYC